LLIGATRRTLERWRAWWRTAFAGSVFWKAAAGRIAALVALGLLPRSKVGRSVEQRALRARRLLTLQGAALAFQVVIILLATALVQAHVS
jgi:hypothetical protein